MTTAPTAPATSRRQIAAWSLWDWGSSAFSVIVTTFVFTRWLSSEAFVDPAVVAAAEAEGAVAGPASRALDAVLAQHTSWLGWAVAAAGLVIAVLAPAMGARSDATAGRRRSLGVQSALAIAVTFAMATVSPDPDALRRNLLWGIALLAVGTVTMELAQVPYNALLSQVSTPATVGRVSGIGWGAGYLGGILVLLVVYLGFIAPEVGWFGVTSAGGWDVRASLLVAAVWFAVFTIPVLVTVPEPPAAPVRPHGVRDTYRQVVADVRRLWRTDRPTLWFLLASAVYRDGLAGVFTFGAVLGSVVWGLSAADIVLFAIAGNVVAGVATVAAGWLDDRLGSRRLIMASLVVLVATGATMFALYDRGPMVFWVGGLVLATGVGPAQAASRSLLSRVTPDDREAETFGLYAMTGRAGSFLSPAAYAGAISLFGGAHWGILGIIGVLAVGLALFWPIRGLEPARSV